MANCEKEKQTFSDRVAELNDLLAKNEIDAQEYQDEHDAASTTFGITLITTWPC